MTNAKEQKGTALEREGDKGRAKEGKVRGGKECGEGRKDGIDTKAMEGR